MSTLPRIAICTSGLGPRLGGIGVVAQMMHDALKPVAHVRVWKHHHKLPPAQRLLWLAAQATVDIRSEYVIYDHIDLARLHAVNPVLRGRSAAVFIHGIEVWKPVTWLHERAFRVADEVWSNSHFTVQKARGVNPVLERDISIIPLGANIDSVAKNSAGKEPLAVFVSRMQANERYKGHDAVIDAWPKITREVPKARLLIVGDGDDRTRLAQKARKMSSVEFCGFVSEREKRDIYARARLHLFPSTCEGFGITAIEAAAYGIPTLALKGTVLEEIFEANEAVWTNEQTAASIAAAAIPVLKSHKHAIRIGDAAKQHVERSFTAHAFYQRIREVVGRWISKRGQLPAQWIALDRTDNR